MDAGVPSGDAPADGKAPLASPPGPGPGEARGTTRALLFLVLVISTAGLVYELAMAAVASYLLGDSVKQFSLIIGVYLSALGLGAWLSRFFDRHLSRTFVDVELAAAVLGGLSAPALFFAFGYTRAFSLVLYALVIVVGALVGLELPLLMRILQRRIEFKDLVAKALTFDYAGALLGSLGFSLLLIPLVGLVHATLLCGLLNAAVALVATWLLPVEDAEEARSLHGARARAFVVVLLLLAALSQGQRFADATEGALYPDPVVVADRSAHQRIVLTERAGTVRLYLNGNLQLSSDDEHRYHEALVHPAMAVADRRARVLIGGGGDGLAAREVLRWSDVESITLVDLDRRVTDLARSDERLARLNRAALEDPRVRVVNADAMAWIAASDERFDVVLLDFPDPGTYAVGKLYSTRFYRSVRRVVAPGGALVVQSTSPLFARRAFWCVVQTLETVGFAVAPYHAFVPSFGEWGYVLAKHEPFDPPSAFPVANLRYLSSTPASSLFDFPPDMARVAAEPNRLDNQAIVGYYLDAWERWN